MTIIRLRSVCLAATLLAAPAWAQTAPIEVQNSWARATSASQTVGGVFLTLTDHGAPDRLLSASSPVADHLELHKTVEEAGVMKMLPIPALDLATGQSVELKPGSYHLMVMGLKHSLEKGASFPVTLQFEKAGAVTAMVTVQAAGAGGPAMGGMKMDNMGGMKMSAPTKP